jgi:hypothetical protein
MTLKILTLKSLKIVLYLKNNNSLKVIYIIITFILKLLIIIN